jgi:hypothetical protein
MQNFLVIYLESVLARILLIGKQYN